MPTKLIPFIIKSLVQQSVNELTFKSISLIQVGGLLLLAISIFISGIALKTNGLLLKELFFSQGVVLLILVMSNFKNK